MRALPLVVAAVLVGIALAPVAGASHNMGHRYLVYGRLLDSSGMPVQNQNVEIRLSLGGELVSSIVTRTDCLGDFDAWKGTKGPAQGAPGGEGAGEIEEFPAQGERPAYANFHFHDIHLSSRHKFELRVGSESFQAGFNPGTRQTNILHQLTGAFGPACGNYDQFNTTFMVRTYIAHMNEMTWLQEPVFRPRTVNVTYGEPVQTNASVMSDFMYAATALLNVAPSKDTVFTITSAEVGTETHRVGADQLKFHRYDDINVLGGSGGGGADVGDFRFFGIVILVGALLVGGFWAGSRMKSKYDEKRLRETSTRRRFRKDREQP
ncbi:MAG: hypothetical protein HYT80_01190 [Euryarchaeota archaeon]|nr:hypothetical protein [Euryarchaeota archaeon]